MSKLQLKSMMRIQEVSQRSHVSVRTLQYYDSIGLLKPSARTEAGYRLYDEENLARLQEILLFRELGFPLSQIADILESKNYDRISALETQIHLLELKKEHIENLIIFAHGVKMMGLKGVDFMTFDMKKIDEYTAEAKRKWGDSKEYQEFEEKSRGRTDRDDALLAAGIEGIFHEFGELMRADAPETEVMAQVEKLRRFITDNCYTCSVKVLRGLGKMWTGGGEFEESIDCAGGIGTAAYAAAAIERYAVAKGNEE